MIHEMKYWYLMKTQKDILEPFRSKFALAGLLLGGGEPNNCFPLSGGAFLQEEFKKLGI